MSHEITDTDEMFSVREMPWHGLGTILEENPTRIEAQELVHPWEPVTQDVYRRVPTITPEGELSHYYDLIEDSKAIVRDDNGGHLAVVGEDYQLVQNSEMWDVAEAVGNIGTDIHIETAGSLRGGKQVWILLRLAEAMQVTGDPHGATVAYLALQNGHDGRGSFRAQAINTRIVCANTSAAADVAAKKNGYEFTFRHSKNVHERLEDAKNVVSMWREGAEQWNEAMNVLAEVRLTDAQVTQYVEKFHPMPPARLLTDRVRENVEGARGELYGILGSETCADVDKTAYGLVQASLEWAQHVRPTRANDPVSRMENRFRRSMLTNDRLGRDAIALAKEVAGV